MHWLRNKTLGWCCICIATGLTAGFTAITVAAYKLQYPGVPFAPIVPWSWWGVPGLLLLIGILLATTSKTRKG